MSKLNARQYVRIPHSLLATDGIKASTIAAYAALASYADKDGFSWPSVPSIAKRAGLSEKVARRECNHLVKLGYLVKTPHFDGPGAQRSNRYTLTWQRDNVVENVPTARPKRPSPLTFPPVEPPGEIETRTNFNDNYNHLTTAASLVNKAWSPKGQTQKKQGVARIVADALENGIPTEKLEAALRILERDRKYVSAYSLNAALNPRPLFAELLADRTYDWSNASEDL